ncbi:unnamed protein product [Ilex paraguariensis]|uniref:U-box domain-containing protein n=1 Tax=Ilex paraguariensis TaxID=185542 RepID=A0ABC8QQC7_9AQUA
MVKENSEGLYVTVPSFFRCPISMDVMKSPVSLCTGVTYDRSSIQTWLGQGHKTCPATMQVLQSTDVVPNLTLRRLIHIWSDSLDSNVASTSSTPIISKQQAVDFIKSFANKKADNYSCNLSKIVDFAKFSDDNREFLVNLNYFVPITVAVLKNAADEIHICESVIALFDLTLSEKGVKEQLNTSLIKGDRDCLSPFILLLRKGSLNSKIQSARVLDSIALDAQSQRIITEKQGLLYELYRLITSETDRTALEAVLSLLITISTSRHVKKELVRFGIVPTVGKILSGSDSAGTTMDEKALKLLEMVATCTEGRTAICDDERCITAIVHRLMKCSSVATEHGVTVIWRVCCLARDKKAREVVMRSNGLTKMLLVMQSGCSGRVDEVFECGDGARCYGDLERSGCSGSVSQMCADLVKVLRVNSKSCLAVYDTKTTHIMPY